MNKSTLRKLGGLLAALLAVSPALADRVALTDGSVIHGKVVSAENGKLLIETSFAGTLVITQSEIKEFTTDEAVNVSLPTGSSVLGRVAPGGAGVKVESANADLTAAPAEIAALWRVGAESPAARTAREAAEKAARNWAYEASLAITGRTGASEKFNSALGLKATLAGPSDKLVFALAAESAKDNGVKTADRQFGGVDYSAFLASGNGWYVRTSLEKDEIKGIDLRSLTAAGYSRKLIRKEHQDLELRLGASYLYETYLVGPDFESPGLDVTVLHSYQFSIAKLTSMLTYTPAFEDFANYRVTHESSLELPLTASLWKLKLGLNNQYQSKPPLGVDKLDTTYFTSLILSWD